MRLAPAAIALGERRFDLRPLTLAQVQAIEPLVSDTAGATPIATAIAIIRIGLERDHGRDAAALDAFEASAPDVAAAVAVVLRLGGFLPETSGAGDPVPGEAGAGAPPA